MERHIQSAAKSGAKKLEVLEAIEIGLKMGRGSATVSVSFALGVFYRCV